MSTEPDAGGEPTTFATPTPPFPPPSPTDRAGDGNRRFGPLLGLLALVGLAVALLMTILWLGARGDRDDAIEDRDAAIVERDAATDARIAAETELTATQSALDSAESAPAADDELAAEVDDLTTQNDELTASNEDLTSANEELAARVAELETELAEAQAALEAAGDAAAPDTTPETTEPAETAPPDTVPPSTTIAETPAAPASSFDPATAPEFARYIGEVLSSASGSSRLGATQSTCFGTEVIRAIGLDALGAGLHNARTNDANNVVVGAMQTAAGICGIDPGLVFG